MKYIVVCGAVISGLGKGVIISSIGLILKSYGYRITAIKIDPYINIDAGTFSPYEHGEVFVLNDGSEVDLDLGNYERFLDLELSSINNITTGKIYKNVIERERKGDYLGKTVQVIPHITDAIQSWIAHASEIPCDESGDIMPDICLIELGGTTGDIESMPFIEALRQYQGRVGRCNFCIIMVSLLPYLKTTGEAKTKPTQEAIRIIRGLGLAPDIIIARCEVGISRDINQKISMFCDVPLDCVVCVPDQKNIFQVPLLLEENFKISSKILKRLHMPVQANIKNGPQSFEKWHELVRRTEGIENMKSVTIGLVGKYTEFRDAYTSVIKALEHASILCSRKLISRFPDTILLRETHTLIYCILTLKDFRVLGD
ncbi:hypothetical protein ACOME3_008911 [Neoechinorhynchus agilis]